MAVLQVGATGSFLLFVVLPGIALAAAIAFSGYEVYRIGERKLLIVIVILALMFQHQVLEAVSFVQTGESVGEGFGEVFETGANLVASGSVYYVLRFARRERRLVDDLERHRRRFQLIAEHIDEIIYLATDDFSEILYINPAYEEIYGRSVESLYENPRSFVEAAHPDDRAQYEDDIDQMIADIESGHPKDSYNGEYRLLIDDEVRWVRIARFPVENDDGSIDRIVGQVRDITERRQLKQAYQDVFENVSDGLVVHEPDTGEMVEVNERFCEMTGYSREELIGETVDRITADEEEYSYERAKQLIQRARDEGPQLFEWQEQRKNGDTYPVEVHLSLVELRGQERVLASVRDITERKQRQRQLEETKRRFELVTENIDEVIFISRGLVTVPEVYDDDADLETEYVSPAFEDVWGQSLDTLAEVSEVFTAAIHPEDRERYRERLREIVADARRDDAEERYEMDFRIERPDGEIRWVTTTAIPVGRQDAGVHRWVGTIKDITERKQREREYEQIFNGVKDAINIMDPETLEIVDANEAYLDLFGYDDFELIRREGVEGLSLTEEGFTPETGQAIHQRVAESREPEVVEWRAETADGKRLWLEIKVTPAVINREQRNIVIHRDITERKRREQRLEVFNRILRHNLRNQLDVIKSHAEALADRTDNDHSGRIIASADRLAGMGERARQIDQCLSREIQPTQIDITTTLHQSLETATDSQDVEVTTELPSDASLVTDEEVLDAILDGVLENAFTYAESSVTVTVEPGSDEHTIVVADDGPGIPEDQLASIKAGRETDLQHGRGLGLWQIKWGVEKLNGTLSFDTDSGTTVRITLPNHEQLSAT